MCSFSQPKMPSIAPVPTVAPVMIPDAADPSVQAARDEQRRRATETSGRASTILTSEAGLSGGPAVRKTLLGQ